MKPKPKTRVLFRVFRGEVIALFPAEAGTADLGTCSSYAHVGQHSSADLQGIIRASRPATRVESGPLACELRRAGYRLDIRQKTTAADLESRRKQIS